VLGIGFVKKPAVGEFPHAAPAFEYCCGGGVPHMLAVFGPPNCVYEVDWSEGGASGKPNPIGALLIVPCC
jgi:hypothetical protein